MEILILLLTALLNQFNDFEMVEKWLNFIDNSTYILILLQKPPEAKAAACTAKPGNRSFLPQTETLPTNQTIVFYCTV